MDEAPPGALPTGSIEPLGTVPLGELDPYALFVKALGMEDRPITDPYRRYMGSQYMGFLNPFRFQALLGNRVGAGGLFNEGSQAPGFADYLSVVQNPMQARQNAADLFARSVQGGFGAGTAAQELLGNLIGSQGQFSPFGALEDNQRNVLNAFGSLGQQALQNRIGSAAMNLFGRSLPSAEDVYTDYFTRSQAGQDVAPTFGQALQRAYGLGV